MLPITKDQLTETMRKLEVLEITTATIRQIVGLSHELESISGEPFTHLEMGNPGLPAEQIGIEAECAALHSGVANQYPNIAGIPQLKDNGSRFLKAFLDVDVQPRGVIPTVGSMQASMTLMILLRQRIPGKDTMLFLDPGFPAQHHQAKLLGLKSEAFDIYNHRGKKLEQKLESYLSKGNITALIYSNPNNPAWTNLTDEELEIIGRLATKHDCIVIEDLAYMGMDFRRDLSHPYEAPYISTVAKYTDNYILLVSASKIFSYAGQRIALVCMGDKVYGRHYETLEKFYEMPTFGDAYVFGVLYCSSSGTSHSAQYGMAAMLGAAVEGRLDFVGHTREYGRRAGIMKEILARHGFRIVYEMDGDSPISDGFFFTSGYGDLSAGELQKELMRYGVSCISLPSTGSRQPGVRVCVSLMSAPEDFERFDRQLALFAKDHPLT